jgi:hypothetical protein
MVRSIRDIIDGFRERLEAVNSPLAQFNNYSSIYAIYRSIASVISEQDSRLLLAIDNAFISSASGAYLDAKANDLGMSRQEASVSKGYILINGPSINIAPGMILSSPEELYQYEVESSINITNGVESTFPITGLSSDINSNLPAGSLLYNSSYPSLTIMVGRYRDPITRLPMGGLVGANPRETDIELRERLINKLSNRELKGTASYILDRLRTIPYLSRVFIREHYPVGGYFTVYIDSNDKDVINNVSNLLSRIKPVGSQFLVKPLVINPIDIDIEVSNTTLTINNIRSQALSIIRDYINTLGPNSILYPDQLASRLMIGLGNVRVINPTTLVQGPSDTLLDVGRLGINLRS